MMKRLIALLTGSFLLSTSLLNGLALANHSSDHEVPGNTNYVADTVITETSGLTFEVSNDAASYDASNTSTWRDVSIWTSEDDALYFGFEDTFEGLAIDLFEELSGGSHVTEYWDGNSWEFLNTTGSGDTFQNDASEGAFFKEWDAPSNWTQRTILMNITESGLTNDVDSDYLYFVRLRITSDYDEIAVEANQMAVQMYNLFLSVEDEEGRSLDGSSTSFTAEVGGDNTIYGEKDHGNGDTSYVFNAKTGTDYTYTTTLDGYVQKSGAVTLDKNQSTRTVEMDYAYVAIVEDDLGRAITNASVTAGDSLDIPCDNLGNGEYGCPVSITQTSGNVHISASGFDVLSTEFSSRRNNHFDNQIRQIFRLTDDDSIAGIDLEVSDIYLEDEDEIFFELRNIGDQSVSNGVSVHTYLYVDDILEWSTTTENSSSTINFLDAGHSTHYDVGDLDLDENETYRITVEVDARDAVNESNENNNIRTETLTIGDDGEPDNGDQECDFVDIHRSFAEDEIIELCEEGVFKGRTSTHFVPTASMSRAELVKTMLLSAGYEPYPVLSIELHDMDRDHWAHEYMTFAVQLGIIDYNDGFVRPDDSVTRGEAAVIVARTYGQELWDYTREDIIFYDVSVYDWFAYAVVILTEEDVIEGYTDYTYRPENNISREEVAIVAARAAEAFY